MELMCVDMNEHSSVSSHDVLPPHEGNYCVSP